jgi:hypothetical protein
MLADVCVKHALYDHSPSLALQVKSHVLYEIALGKAIQDVEGSGKMMVFEH